MNKTMQTAYKILYALEHKKKGAEYLRENNVMREIAKIATNVITIAKP